MSRRETESRRDAIRRRVAAMVAAGLPPEWQSWDASRAASFKADYRDVFTTQTIEKLRIPAARLAALCGRTIEEIDPGEVTA